jgi:hypothetical protein
MATHVILIPAAAPGKFNVRLDGDARLFVESTDMPYLESATRLLAGGLALPEDMLIMRFSGSVWEVRRGRVGDAAKGAGRPPVRLIARSDVAIAPSSKTHPRPPYGRWLRV